MRFYVLKNPEIEESTATTDFVDVDPVNLGKSPRCEACGKPIGSRIWLPPYRVELEIWYKAYGDISIGTGNNMLVSERFKTLYEESGLTGLYGFDPVEVVRVKRFGKAKGFKAKPPPYYRVSVVRSKAAIDISKSLLRDEPGETCPVCRSGDWAVMRILRVVLEPSTWSGEDIFIARGLPGTYITTERFKTFCEKNNIANAVLIPAEEYRNDFGLGWDDEDLKELF